MKNQTIIEKYYAICRDCEYALCLSDYSAQKVVHEDYLLESDKIMSSYELSHEQIEKCKYLNEVNMNDMNRAEFENGLEEAGIDY